MNMLLNKLTCLSSFGKLLNFSAARRLISSLERSGCSSSKSVWFSANHNSKALTGLEITKNTKIDQETNRNKKHAPIHVTRNHGSLSKSKLYTDQ